MFKELPLFFPPLLCSFAAFTEICGRSPSPCLLKQKKSCLLFWNSPSKPGSNPHLKWLSKELKAIRRSQGGLFRLTLTQQPKAYAARSLQYGWKLKSPIHNGGVTSEEFISSVSIHGTPLKPLILAAFLNFLYNRMIHCCLCSSFKDFFVCTNRHGWCI